jgi:hydroxymethylpyrimidine kinase/phosphomethylpyrimidine kinase
MARTEDRKLCLSIAGFDPSGGAGIIVDVQTFSAFGCRSAVAITSITFQNSKAVFGVQHQTARSVRHQLEAIFGDNDVAAVKIGMLPTVDLTVEVAEALKQHAAPNIVFDPVLRSTSGFDLVEADVIPALVQNIFPLLSLVTPNIPEAERFAGSKISGEDDIAQAASVFQQLGAKSVLIKGGHFECESANARDFLFVEGDLTIFESDRIPGPAMRGTGCRLSSAIAANLAGGKVLTESVRIAKDFVREEILRA